MIQTSSAPVRTPTLTGILLMVMIVPPPTALRAQPISVQTIERQALVGELRTFSLKNGLTWVDISGRETVVAAAELVRVSTAVTSSPPSSDSTLLVLAGGNRLYGRIVGGNEEVVRVNASGLPPLAIPLIDVVALQSPGAWARTLPRTAGPSNPSADQDLVILSNGDRISGGVVKIGSAGVTLETDQGDMVVAHDRLQEVVMQSFAPPPSPGIRARILLTDGTQLEASALEWTSGRLTSRVFDQDLEIPAQRVLRIEVIGGRWQWLSALEPVQAKHTPYLTLTWPWQRDRNVLGKPLRIGETRYDRGIGVHSQSRLVYDLSGKYRSFFSHYGLDESAGVLADVDIEVRVDGETRFQKTGINKANGHEARSPIRIDVTGAQRLELLVSFGRNGDVQDRFNWAGAALIR